MGAIYINSVADYLKEVFKWVEDNEDKKFYFRGQPDSSWDLTPSAFRGNNLENEDVLFYQSSSLLSEEFSSDMTAFDKLVRMQHYGIPTRLLDVSTNPLVALYFACSDEKCKNSKVFCFAVSTREIKNYDSDCVTMLSNLAKCKKETIMWELVHQVKQERDFEEMYIDREDLNRSFFVNPKRNNDRIKAQSGAFIIVGGVSISPHDVVEKRQMLPKIQSFDIEINSYAKYKLLEELNVLGVNKGNLYCDMEYKFEEIKKSIK